jgi:hypothetical protein
MSRFTLGQKIQFIIGIKNVGKMTANKTSCRQIIGLAEPGEKLHWEKLSVPKSKLNGPDILPGTTYPTPIESNFILNQNMIDNINSGKQILIVLLKFDYKDCFGFNHTVNVCEKFLINEKRLGLCQDNNYVVQ